jgi:K(+)-stimulated pyrophosphate-energized sodium pump
MKNTFNGGFRNASSRGAMLLLTLLAALIPAIAQAAGGENVKLAFTNSDKIYLYASLGLGLFAILVAIGTMQSLLKAPTGGEKMEEVGSAIREGAMAYLRRQIISMAPFVAVIAGLLYFLYAPRFGASLAIYTGVAFIGGVAASYLAGYAGMFMAVNANMRTAAAALSSYSKALQIAFRSGAVAGLFTVGMGLIGATAIFLLAGSDAMKLLVGFGFGGSLAALFMRVGGGIYTKAADVGADLVGKVEAGIPEDDPRNPAVIADNVGDNVGDCAGMAADVFESYEVTLVAAIVLGAATSVIFDQQTWMKLILFALVARGVGIIASIMGIFMVKGSDDLNSDPLKPISAGFKTSALIAAALTAIVAFLMLGGVAGSDKIQAANLTSQQQGQQLLFDDVKREQKAIAEKKYKGDVTKVTADDFKTVEWGKKFNFDKPQSNLPQLLAATPETRPEAKPLEGFSKLSPGDTNEALNYSIQAPPKDTSNPQEAREYMSIKKFLEEHGPTAKDKTKVFKLWRIEITRPAAQGGPATPDVNTGWYGPIDETSLNALVANVTKQQPTLKIKTIKGQEKDIEILASRDGKLALGFENFDMRETFSPLTFQPSYYKLSATEVKAKMDEVQKNPQASASAPQPQMMQVAGVKFQTAEWWQFALCIGFGILMAFAFERLTDYYVSTDRKPVQEVANVATAGPAPMIIQGFSYGMESSVFSVLAIVISLIAPMQIFPPELYGGYILSFYGIALVGLGLLTTTGYILAMDTFGPISDNAQGVFEMSGAGHDNPEASRAVQRLDAAGNTTKALTKGFAIATAVVAAVALFHSYVEEAQLTTIGMRLEVPEIFLGLLIGGAAPFLFSAFSINAVGRAAFALISEVRRQFRNDPGIMAGTSKPDYATCVAIVTKAAQRELLGPGILAIALPLAVAFGFSIGKPSVDINGVSYNLVGAQALGGFLAGTILSGQLLAVTLANSGGMWDNAKKLIEDGLHGGKGTEAHKAGVVCDTVGDPFKDTAGPALNPLIKVMNLVALLIAPIVIVPPANKMTTIIITVVCVAALVFSFWWSKRGSMSESMTAAQNEG